MENMTDLKKLRDDMFMYRVNNEMTQTEFANMCHLSLQTVNSVENGKQVPGKMTRAKICKLIYACEEKNNVENDEAE